ncbi:MAG: type III-B CRISPR module RAMP protein Cmr1 [Bacillota bacterium]|jgi:CRISPR-associated protein Cmr1
MKIVATYKIVTEMFMGDKDPNTSARLRVASVKGALRFWFRAISLAQYQTWEKVQEAEADVFGGINKQAAILMSLEGFSKLSTKPNSQIWKGGRGYLAYGLEREKTSGNKKELRPYIEPRQIFSLNFLVRKSNIDISNFLKAVKLLGLIGGLGSRSRRGFGSVVLKSLLIDGNEEWNSATTVDDLKKQIQSVVPAKLPVDLPEYTAFSQSSRIVILKKSHEDIGIALRKHRKHEFKQDGKIIRNVSGGNKVTEHPKRLAFGLPHNYHSGKDKELVITSKMHERRASPFFIHIHELNGKQVCVLSFIPARFLPAGDKILYKNWGIEVDCRDEAELYKVIEDFIDSNKGKTEVLP